MSQPIAVTRQTFDDVMVPNYAPAQMVPVRGEGSRMWDQQGREYVDFTGGIAVNALGHANPELVKVIEEQARKVWHIGNGYTNEPVLRLAKALTEATFADKAFFCNSGLEANEAALKLARRYAYDHAAERGGKEKSEIISFFNSFHGRSLFTVSVGGQAKYTEGFGPIPAGIMHLPYNDLKTVEATISDATAAVIVEPVQGEGGVLPADPSFLKGLRALCDKHGALLIFDEVQTGVGRTGTLYAYEQYGVTPDILTTAKALGNGYPIGGILTTSKIAASFSPGTHGCTYGGNPLATAIAGRVLELINTAETLNGVKARHDHFIKGIEGINARHGVFEQVRGMGLLIGAVLKPAFAGRAKDIVTESEKNGLMLLVAGADVVRFAPSLNIPFADIDAGLASLEKAVATVAATAKAA
ncbi:aspartate aminotransferase family protein [Pandoraea fibrosis]|uniref:Acetylornithine aminotransferase n=1 Tax=Pandoraea fibrosis TaxID=1891094 RepID=A0A5E4RVS0_9BURK|nr:aspartate aminotransferase family protein [Pandoraea fibrosis]QHE92737.1 acetylornithine/succinylornithine family transaminase [Pandoraea fibrosis]QHF13706.1 acetylornithine/succinylornithine family transaminase [Pandoraea fibrosis]VVD65948.1 acetylornithine aminotransferase [Pandoraea fibrosis]